MGPLGLLGVVGPALLTGALVGFVALRYPALLLTLYALAAVQLFGFLESEVVLGRAALDPLLLLVLLACGIVCLRIVPRGVPRDPLLPLLVVTGVLAGWGLLAPVLLDGSSGFAALRDGRDFLGYLLLAYLMVRRPRLSPVHVKVLATWVGLVLAVLVLGWELLALRPPAYWLTDDASGHPRLSGPFGAFILLAFSLEVAQWTEARLGSRRLLRILVLLTALGLQGHRSVFLAALLVSAGVVYLRMRRRRGLAALAVSVLGLSLLYPVVGPNLRPLVLDPVQELVYRKGAIAARLRADAARWVAVRERPWAGYGFVDETSPLGRRFMTAADSRFEQTLGTVDGGYLDLLVRFGILGTSALLLTFGGLPLRVLRSRDGDAAASGAALFLLSYYPVAVTWSVFSYAHGIAPAILAFFLVSSPAAAPRLMVAPRAREQQEVVPA
jgi:O-antigen ligase